MRLENKKVDKYLKENDKVYTCFVCGKPVTEDDEFEWFGLDGDKIHKKCKPNLDDACEFINNMTDKEFEKYLLGN